MTIASPPHRFTAEDLLRMPDNNSMELVDGQIVEKNVGLVYPNPGKPVILTEEDEITAENALPGFVCKASDLFPAV